MKDSCFTLRHRLTALFSHVATLQDQPRNICVHWLKNKNSLKVNKKVKKVPRIT